MKTTKMLFAATLLSALPCFADTTAESSRPASSDRMESAGRQQTILAAASQAGQFQMLTQLIQEAGLEQSLSGQGPFTLFAPTDEAFKQMPAAKLQQLRQDKAALKKLLQYHVVSGNISASQVASRGQAQTLEGQQLHFSQKNGKMYVNEAEVVTPDIHASNGTIHVIDKVLSPND